MITTVVCASAALILPMPARAGFTRAFTDDVWGDVAPPGWVQQTEASGARLVLLDRSWSDLEPTAPTPGTDPTNPGDPQYNWTDTDTLVREFAGTGISVALLISEAPAWAEAPGGPAALEADGAWEPNVTAFGKFATALARRYSGSYPDPLHPGHNLPRVRYFQAWAEANFSVHLAPQWTKHRGAWVPVGPGIYRNLLNVFYAGIKSVHSDNVVVTTGFGPYGDSPGRCANTTAGFGPGCRMPPAMFARELLCLRGQALRPESCPDPAHFDALAMDPYEVGSPTTRALNADDVSAPDLGKLTSVVNKAVRTGRALPRRHKQLWITEFGYDSRPPNPTAPSLVTQARWLEEAFYIFWKEGVSTVVWYLIRDQAATYNASTYYGGVYFYDGAPKPSAEAFRFPFVVMPSGHSAIAWGISPRTGYLVGQHQQGRSWHTLFQARASAGSVFVHKVPASLHGNFRAVVGGEQSVVWHR